MRPDPKRQAVKAEALAGLYRPYVDPETHAADILDAMRPLIVAQLAELRAPRPAPSARDKAMMAACREVGTAIDNYEQAKFASRAISVGALRRLEKAARKLRDVMAAKQHRNMQTGDRE